MRFSGAPGLAQPAGPPGCRVFTGRMWRQGTGRRPGRIA